MLYTVRYVRMWGPIWAWSMFSSEDGNGELFKIAHGSKNMDIEIQNTIKFLLHIEKPNTSEIELIGPPADHTLTNDERAAIQNSIFVLYEEEMLQTIKIYWKCIINNEIQVEKTAVIFTFTGIIVRPLA